MIKAELSYNPYLLKTDIKFNGQPPRVNSLVEKYQHKNLQSWINRIPKIFYDEMNGYYFELDFTGTKLDYESLCNTFRKAGITEEIVPIVHKECLEERVVKQKELDELLAWLEENRNCRFNYDEFRADNSDLFDGSYSYVFLHGRGLNGSILEDMNVSVEYVDKVEELNNTNLDCTPILIYITAKTLLVLGSDLAYFKAKPEVSEEQLFFMIEETLNTKTVERVIKDLGIANPNIIQAPDDLSVQKYIKVYSITTYLWNALNILRENAEHIKTEFIRDYEVSENTNSEIHRKINQIEDKISNLKNALRSITEYRDTVELSSASLVNDDLLKKVNSWHSKKTIIYTNEEAVKAAFSFEKDVMQWMQDFGQKVKKEAEEAKNNIKEDLASEYNNAGYEEFQPTTPEVQIPDMKSIEPFFNELLNRKLERYVEVKEDLIGKLFKGRQSDEKQMQLETTYYYSHWRSYVAELVNYSAYEYLFLIESKCELYAKKLKMEYKEQIEKAVAAEQARKDETAAQLSEDEKKLQNDKEWLTKYIDQITAIERG